MCVFKQKQILSLYKERKWSFCLSQLVYYQKCRYQCLHQLCTMNEAQLDNNFTRNPPGPLLQFTQKLESSCTEVFISTVVLMPPCQGAPTQNFRHSEIANLAKSKQHQEREKTVNTLSSLLRSTTVKERNERGNIRLTSVQQEKQSQVVSAIS